MFIRGWAADKKDRGAISLYLTDPKHLREPLPEWFLPIYDSFVQKKPVDASSCIRRQSVILTRRVRFVYHLMQEANFKLAAKDKANHVFNWSDFHPV